MTSYLIVKVPVEKESSLSMGGAIMVEIHQTVGKLAKRMPDATVETTDIFKVWDVVVILSKELDVKVI